MTECVCVRERERERDRKRDRKRDREREEKRTGASGRERGKYVERKRAGDSTHVLARERVCVCTHVCVFCVCTHFVCVRLTCQHKWEKWYLLGC